MKIKNILFAIGIACLSSCSDFLNIVPDDMPTLDHAFQDRVSTERFLFTCYRSTLPSFTDIGGNPAFMSGGEFACLNSGYAWRGGDSDPITPGYYIMLGRQNPNNPYNNFWDGGTFQGIRNCNIFFENIDKPIDLTEKEKTRWIGEVRFLRAFAHYWLFQMYGPIPIIDKNLLVDSAPDEVKIYREPVDKVVDFIVQELDEAAKGLPDVISDPTNELGRITRPAALALKAKVLALAASPLFNGNPEYVGIKDNRGVELFPATKDNNKWKLAADAALAAIKAAEMDNNHQLYYFKSTRPLNDTTVMKMNIRGSVTDNYNEEIIWASTNNPDGLQRAAMPSLSMDITSTVSSELAVPLAIAEEFYSENGVPINEDKFYQYTNRYKLRTAKSNERFYVREGETTAILNFNREPRFYASLAFDRGIIYGAGVLNDAIPETGASDTNTPKVVKARKSEMSGMRSVECYSVTGYFPKKLVHWESSYTDPRNFKTTLYHLPLIRLADLYLLYAEAQTEYSDEVDPAVYPYIDAIRKRASLGGVVESWKKYSNDEDKPKNKLGLLSIIHQERMIELAFEGQRYWDMRRWKTLEAYLSKPLCGWNVKGDNIKNYYEVKDVVVPSFNRKNYLWPIKQSSLDQNINLVQNPGWK